MRDEFKAALQARWEESLRARAAIDPRSPVPLLDELLARHTARPPGNQHSQRHHERPSGSRQHPRGAQAAGRKPRMTGDCCTFVLYGPARTVISRSQYGPDLGGASETRTRDPLLANRRIFLV
jgi:hypothetical protein